MVFVRRRFRNREGRHFQQEGVPPFQGVLLFLSRLYAETEIVQGVSEFRPADQGSGPSWRHSVQGGLNGEDGAQPAADPSRDGHGPGNFFHEDGTGFVQRAVVRDAVTMARERRLL